MGRLDVGFLDDNLGRDAREQRYMRRCDCVRQDHLRSKPKAIFDHFPLLVLLSKYADMRVGVVVVCGQFNEAGIQAISPQLAQAAFHFRQPPKLPHSPPRTADPAYAAASNPG